MGQQGMKMRKNLNLFIAIMAMVGFAACQPSAPAKVRFKTSLVDTALSSMVVEEHAIGVSALVFKDGQEVYFGAYGMADREAGRPMSRDAMANIYSMTKPITGVTLMTLYEEGLFELDDPLSKYLPEFENVKVHVGVSDDGTPILEAPVRPVTVLDIMRHTAGFSYGWGEHPVDVELRSASPMDPSKPLSQFSQEIAALPLKYQPGTQWEYSVAVDVQARLAEVLSGQSYEALVQARVLGPLGMGDTAYFVEDKRHVTPVYMLNGKDGFDREPDDLVYGFWKEKPVQINGGHGLISTLDDYMQFSRMLLGKGELDGVRILKPETIALMSTNHLPAGIKEKHFLPGKGQMGFGIDFAVRIAPPIDETENPGEVGEFFWDGRASTLFWVDPKNDLTAVFFVQVVPFDGDLHHKFRTAVYEAIR